MAATIGHLARPAPQSSPKYEPYVAYCAPCSLGSSANSVFLRSASRPLILSGMRLAICGGSSGREDPLGKMMLYYTA
jgi:hypothetical protein